MHDRDLNESLEDRTLTNNLMLPNEISITRTALPPIKMFFKRETMGTPKHSSLLPRLYLVLYKLMGKHIAEDFIEQREV